ncbi:MAG: cupin domain-containing protein, partial [Sneathiella sp.]
MQINSDFSKRIFVHGDKEPWHPSPMTGVHRRMLDRVGDEVARATTIVRYAAGSSFSAHNHDGGEEFVVLAGVFQDEHGDYPAGTYVRNPPGTAHTPRSDKGCTILVKLWQFDPNDTDQFSIDMSSITPMSTNEEARINSSLLFEDGRERVTFEKWSSGDVSAGAEGGAEIFVLAGGFELDGEVLFPIHGFACLKGIMQDF